MTTSRVEAEKQVWVRVSSEEWEVGTEQGRLENGLVRVHLTGEDPKLVEVPAADVFPCNKPTQDGEEELSRLDHLHEAAVVHNLRVRFAKQSPYTSAVGMCIAVNPYKVYHDLYSERTQDAYFETHWNQRNGEDLSPHIYHIASRALVELNKNNQSQSILISGESGAGKTESTKYTLQYLARISNRLEGNPENAGNFDSDSVRGILQSSPLLEAFGNAKTVRNDNSSRFGKFIRLEFERTNGPLSPAVLSGGHLETYLLEKSRVVHQSDGERNYHIFYQLLNRGIDDELPIQIPDGSTFRFLRGNNQPSIDRARGKETGHAMEALGLLPRLQDIKKILLAVLYLGQLEPSFTDEGNEEKGSRLDGTKDSQATLTILQQLLGCQSQEAISTSLCEKTITVGKETFKSKLTPQDVASNCQSLAKGLYAWLFDWVVQNVNQSIAARGAGSSRGDSVKATIGVLDIFGFECFQLNSLEQLCINLTNERLQQIFNESVLLETQLEYEQEGIPWTRIPYADGAVTIEKLQGKTGSVFALLEEESLRPKGTATAFVSKLLASKDSQSCLSHDRFDALSFTVQHYACPVKYTAHTFLEKNCDTLHVDMMAFLESQCSNTLVKDILHLHQQNANLADAESKRKSRSMTAHTLTKKFKKQLDSLVGTISSTKPHFIRCIKPNETQSSESFQNAQVLQQLRCSGVMEAIRISRAGFPDRLSHEECLNTFGPPVACWRSCQEDPSSLREVSENLLERWLGTQSSNQNSTALVSPRYIVGETKTFFAPGVLDELRKKLEERRISATLILQAQVRRFLARLFQKRTRAAVRIQQNLRCLLAKLVFSRMRRAAVSLQAFARQQSAIRAFSIKQEANILMQAIVRGFLGKRVTDRVRRHSRAQRIQTCFRRHLHRSRFQEKRHACCCVQAFVRCFQTRAAYLSRLTQIREEQSVRGLKKTIFEMQQQIDSLQAQLAASSSKTIKEEPQEVKNLYKEENPMSLATSESATQDFRRVDENDGMLKAKVSSLQRRVEELEEDKQVLLRANGKLKQFARLLHAKVVSLQASKAGQARQDTIDDQLTTPQANAERQVDHQVKGTFARVNSAKQQDKLKQVTMHADGENSENLPSSANRPTASSTLKSTKKKIQRAKTTPVRNSQEEGTAPSTEAGLFSGGFNVFRNIVHSGESFFTTVKNVGTFILEELDNDIEASLSSTSRNSAPRRQLEPSRQESSQSMNRLVSSQHLQPVSTSVNPTTSSSVHSAQSKAAGQRRILSRRNRRSPNQPTLGAKKLSSEGK